MFVSILRRFMLERFRFIMLAHWAPAFVTDDMHVFARGVEGVVAGGRVTAGGAVVADGCVGVVGVTGAGCPGGAGGVCPNAGAASKDVPASAAIAPMRLKCV